MATQNGRIAPRIIASKGTGRGTIVIDGVGHIRLTTADAVFVLEELGRFVALAASLVGEQTPVGEMAGKLSDAGWRWLPISSVDRERGWWTHGERNVGGLGTEYGICTIMAHEVIKAELEAEN